MEANKTFGQCRCCLADGYHRDIMKSYTFKGEREVYYDLFVDCYNLFLSTNASLSTLICSSCVRQLRAATTFKNMVTDSERRLLQTIGDEDNVFVNVPVDKEHRISELEVKTEHQIEVKMEPDDKIDFDFADQKIDDDDHYDDSEPNIQIPAEDLVEGELELLKRFSLKNLRLPTRESLYNICPGFARHLDMIRGKVITSKTIESLLEQPDCKPKSHSKKIYVTEKYAHITNASTLIENSNVTPFKSKNRTGFPCFYCRNSFENFEHLREHQEHNHKRSEAKKVLATFGGECLIVYVDISNLKCTMCNTFLPNLNELKSHLTKVHKRKMYLEFSDRVIPFKISQNNLFDCQVCGFSFETFGSIERHMNIHFRNYVCKDCGTGFVTKYRLKVHIKSMHMGGTFPCDICKKVFTSQQKLKNHVDAVHKLVKRFKCPKCPERFTEYFRRQKHMVAIHGVAPLQYKCNVCDKAFDRRYTLSRHMKRDHLEERDFQCDVCSYKCFTKNELQVHMIKHNGERIFECSVCKKSYARKKTLKEHMRIHNNDRRFVCAVCGQAFVQKCSLKGHIKTHHVEYNLQI